MIMDSMSEGDLSAIHPVSNGNQIEFTGSVARVRTMADGGLRFEFDAPESAIMQAAQLMECKRFGVPLKVVIEPIYQVEPETKEGETDGKRDRVIKRSTAKKRKQ